MLIFAIAFINGNLMASLFCCSGYVYCGYVIKLANSIVLFIIQFINLPRVVENKKIPIELAYKSNF